MTNKRFYDEAVQNLPKFGPTFAARFRAIFNDPATEAQSEIDTTTLQGKIAVVVQSAESFLTDWEENEGADDPKCAAQVDASESVGPLLTMIPSLLSMLLVAGAELNACPFVNQEVTDDIRALLADPSIAPFVRELVAGASNDDLQESMEELIGTGMPAVDPLHNQTHPGASINKDQDGGLIATEDIERIGSVMLSDLIGSYDAPEKTIEWPWVEQNASFAHYLNGQSGVWEFMLNMSRTFDNAPPIIADLIAEAKSKDLHYLVLHQGT